MHPSFLLRQIVILFNLRFSIIRISLRLNSRCSLSFLFTISSTFCITYGTPNRNNANVLSRLIYFFPGDNACNKKLDRCVYFLGILFFYNACNKKLDRCVYFLGILFFLCFWLVSILRYPRLPLSPFLLQFFKKTGIIDLKLFNDRSYSCVS